MSVCCKDWLQKASLDVTTVERLSKGLLVLHCPHLSTVSLLAQNRNIVAQDGAPIQRSNKLVSHPYDFEVQRDSRRISPYHSPQEIIGT